jgi:cytochrome c biogenesis protein CcmG, thiol:disulfide interchange protein DsbE
MSRFLVPIGFMVLMALLYVGLSLNPREIPSVLIDKPAPEFSLPQLLYPEMTISKNDMLGKVWIFNVWATWCVSCRAEHKVLMALAKTGEVPIVGLNYKDEDQPARGWLEQLGNPYVVNAVDKEGRTGIDYGVYGTPETFIIDKKGIIRHKHTGPIYYEQLEQELLPIVRKLQAEPG